MRRLLFILMFYAVSCIGLAAQVPSDSVPRITFGAEWSYSATFFNGHRYYFLAPEGFRVDDRSDRFKYCADGEVFLHCGCNIGSDWNLSAYIGYTGIGDYHSGIPISLRATRFFGPDPLKDRWFAYCDAGSGISLKKNPEEILTAKLGGGYRMSLSRFTKLDFLASLRFVYTHPDIDFYGERIGTEYISRNIGYILFLWHRINILI